MLQLMTYSNTALEKVSKINQVKMSSGSEIITGHSQHNPQHPIMLFSDFPNHQLITDPFLSSFPIHKWLIALVMNLVTKDA